MKKFMSAALAVVMLAGCTASNVPATDGDSSSAQSSEKKSQDAYYVYATDVRTADYVTTMNTQDQDVLCNLIDGLVEKDTKNNYVPCLAESWEHNDDSSVWTFHLRQGAKWVTNTGEEYGEVKGDDFVAGLQHAVDFQSQALSMVSSYIKGLDDYVNGITNDFTTVGVKALDDYTVEYTLTGPCPYFHTMAGYSIFWPVNREFLEAQGEGCKLGDGDVQACKFGDASDPSSILYNGCYILAANDSKSKQELVKNENYWDAEHVYVEKITNIYDDGSDPGSTVAGFEQVNNPYYAAVLLTTSDNFAEYLKKYEEYAFTGMQSQYSFGVNVNLNRINFDHTEKDDKQRKDAKEALLNADFRRALKFSMDRVAYMAATVDSSIASNAIRNMETPYDFVRTSDGTTYGQLVQNASTLDCNLEEGQDPFHDPKRAMEYIDAAKKALPDVEWPVHLDLMALATDKALYAQAQSLAISVQDSSEGNIVIDIHAVDDDTYNNSSYTSQGPIDADWDLSTSTGWGYDYIDPMTYLHIFSPIDGDVTRQAMGIEFLADGDEENRRAIEESGLMDYQKMLDEADAITDDLDARYTKFAEAEAYLLDEAIYIPVSTSIGSCNWRIQREVPFTRQFQTRKWKGVIIQEEPVTAAEYHAALEEWHK